MGDATLPVSLFRVYLHGASGGGLSRRVVGVHAANGIPRPAGWVGQAEQGCQWAATQSTEDSARRTAPLRVKLHRRSRARFFCPLFKHLCPEYRVVCTYYRPPQRGCILRLRTSCGGLLTLVLPMTPGHEGGKWSPR